MNLNNQQICLTFTPAFVIHVEHSVGKLTIRIAHVDVTYYTRTVEIKITCIPAC